MKSIVATLVAITVTASSAKWDVPLYKQCDRKWANDIMGTKGSGEQSTICGEGCAMSSVSMAMAGLGIDIGCELVVLVLCG
jgi:hypothetical protein